MPPLLAPLGPLARDAVAETLYAAGWTKPERNGPNQLHIVTFHRVLSDSELSEYPLREIAVSTREFSGFVRFFAAHYTCRPLAEAHRRWMAGERPGKPFLAITFDDGQLDNFQNARPILEEAGLRATFFVAADAVEGPQLLWHDRMAYAVQRLSRLGRLRAAAALERLTVPDLADDRAFLLEALERAKKLSPGQRADLIRDLERSSGSSTPSWDGLMTWQHLRALARDGHEVGSHSATHPILTLLDTPALDAEVSGSKRSLEARLDVPCESFCYPNGTFDDGVEEAVRRAGYLRAVTTRWGSNGPQSHRPLRLWRRDMQGPRVVDRRSEFSEARLAFRMSTLFPEPRS